MKLRILDPSPQSLWTRNPERPLLWAMPKPHARDAEAPNISLLLSSSTCGPFQNGTLVPRLWFKISTIPGFQLVRGCPFGGGPFNYLGTKIRPAFFVKLTIVGFSWIRVWTSEDEQTRRQCVILFEHDAVSCSSLESR